MCSERQAAARHAARHAAGHAAGHAARADSPRAVAGVGIAETDHCQIAQFMEQLAAARLREQDNEERLRAALARIVRNVFSESLIAVELGSP